MNISGISCMEHGGIGSLGFSMCLVYGSCNEISENEDGSEIRDCFGSRVELEEDLKVTVGCFIKGVREEV